MGLRIGETLGQERPAAETVTPLIGQRAQRGGEALAGQIGGCALWGEQEAAAVLHEELEPFDARIGAPGNPAVAILERVTSRPPDQERDGLAVALDDLAQVIANGTARAEVMLRGQLLIERGELFWTESVEADGDIAALAGVAGVAEGGIIRGEESKNPVLRLVRILRGAPQ